MAVYLTEAGYMRWYRQYQINLRYYLDVLDQLRIRLDALPSVPEKLEIEHLINDIDENIEKVIPRNFAVNGESLQGFEKFLENTKVLINLFYRLFGKGDRFLGIYSEEKERVLSFHREFKFKEKLKYIHDKIEALEIDEIREQERQAAREQIQKPMAAGQ